MSLELFLILGGVTSTVGCCNVSQLAVKSESKIHKLHPVIVDEEQVKWCGAQQASPLPDNM